METKPFVSVVTPFYNTSKYLAECVESVLHQTYQNWEYILVDNCSDDGSSEIAARYAAQCDKIRVVQTGNFLTQVQNYNFAVSQISPNSRYCKIVQADDWIYPECLERLIVLAESDDSIGFVSSYRLKGGRRLGEGLPCTRSFLTGQDLARLHLTTSLFVFGTPTTVLYRSEIVRMNSPFYDERTFFDDSDLCYRLLRSWNFGFVHDVLSCSRVDDDSIRAKVLDFGPDKLERFVELHKFGPIYLQEEELREALNWAKSDYYQFLAKHIFRDTSRAFWRFHQSELISAGLRLEKLLIAKLLCLGFARLVKHPGATCRRIYHRFRRNHRTAVLNNEAGQ